MGGWRSKFIFLLVVYFAGFATAIYWLAPVEEGQASRLRGKSFASSSLRSGELKQSLKAGFNSDEFKKYMGLAKKRASDVSRYVKRKLEDKYQTSGSGRRDVYDTD